MTITRNRLAPVATAGVLALLALGGLSACDDEQTTNGGASGGGSSSDAPTDDEADGDEDNGDAAQFSSPTGCLVGTWLADNQQLGALFKSAAAGTDAAGAVSDPTGDVLVTFGPDAQYSVTYETWTLSLSQDGMTMELIREGTDTGRYDATDEGVVEWTEVTMGSVTTLKSPAGSFEVPGDPSETSGTFVCGADTLQITADGSTTALDRQ